MLYKPYGNTGAMVSAIGAGGMRFADPDDIDASAEVVQYAHSKGINYLDTAPGYCKDKSEEIFGRAIAGLERDSYFISTKCMASDGDDLRASLEKSLTRLGVDKLDFFHIWCLVRPEQWDQRKAGGAVAAAIKAREEGLLDNLVFSSHMSGEMIGGIIDEDIFAGVTLGYCAINFPYRQYAVDRAAAAGLGVVAMNPLGGGIIPTHADKFDFIRGEHDDNVVKAAIRFVVSQSGVSSALVGFSDIDQVDQAVAALDDFEPYGPEHMDTIKKRITESFDGLCTGCGYCLPCPQGLEIPKLMDAYNHKILADCDSMMGRFRWHWNISPEVAANCTACGACEAACTQKLPIAKRMAEIADAAAAAAAAADTK